MEPVDARAVHDGRELAATYPQGRTHGGETQDHLPTDTVEGHTMYSMYMHGVTHIMNVHTCTRYMSYVYACTYVLMQVAERCLHKYSK